MSVLGDVSVERWEDQVRRDHEELRGQLRALQEALQASLAPGNRQETVSCLVVRILGPELDFHLHKEEKVLFPFIRKVLGLESADIERLEGQHRQLRETLRRLAGLVCEEGCEPSQGRWEEIGTANRQFVALLEEHEKKEDELISRILESGLEPQWAAQLKRDFHQMTWEVLREEM